MALRDIVLDPHPVLRAIAEPVQTIDAEILTLLDDMADTMYEANGIGLAAPQVGVSKRICLVDYGDDFGGLYELINPEYLETSGEVVDVEGCLSIPGLRGNVKRFDKITLRYLNRKGESQLLTAEGYFARVFQHEIDHLNGVLYTDLAVDTFDYDESQIHEVEEG